jgi:Histidine kinase-, DNA gyrase B-, and HSP90-like ATPase
VLELSLHILDMVQNAIEAGASKVEILIDEDLEADRLLIEVKDNGQGMSEDQMAKVLDPFYTTRKTRHIGLGLPLLSEACRHCEGGLTLQSTPGSGTTVRAILRNSHIDRAPLGDMPSVLYAVLLSEHPIDWHYIHQVNGETFQLDSSDIRKELVGVPLSHPKVRKWLLDFLYEGEHGLSGKDIPMRATA